MFSAVAPVQSPEYFWLSKAVGTKEAKMETSVMNTVTGQFESKRRQQGMITTSHTRPSGNVLALAEVSKAALNIDNHA